MISHFTDAPSPQALTKLNAMVDACNMILGMEGDRDFIAVRRQAGGGMTVALNIQNVLPWIPNPQNDLQIQLLVILGHSGTGPTLWGPYHTVTMDGKPGPDVWNGFEPCDGNPGPLGVPVSTAGQFNGGSCYMRPIGDLAKVICIFDPVSQLWWFSAPNYAAKP